MAYKRSSDASSGVTGEPYEDPVFVSLGKAKKKTIKRMKKGKGRLIDEIYATVEEFKKEQAVEGKTLVPLVFIVREKRAKVGGLFG